MSSVIHRASLGWLAGLSGRVFKRFIVGILAATGLALASMSSYAGLVEPSYYYRGPYDVKSPDPDGPVDAANKRHLDEFKECVARAKPQQQGTCNWLKFLTNTPDRPDKTNGLFDSYVTTSIMETQTFSSTGEHVAFQNNVNNTRTFLFTPCPEGSSLKKVVDPSDPTNKLASCECTLFDAQCAKGAQKGPAPPLSCVADPINISVGNSFQQDIDLPRRGGSRLSFSRFYNSLDGLWRHNHSTHLRISGAGVTLVRDHGQESFFSLNGNVITGSVSELGRLSKGANGWVYSTPGNDSYTFDNEGRLLRWNNTAGEEQQLVYANGSVTVTDQLGRSLSFTEDGQHQPLSLSAEGLQITYDYNARQNLTQLTRTQDGQTTQRQFHYEDPRDPKLLTGLTDERGVRFTTWTFDDKGRATSSEHLGMEHTQVAYNADGSVTVTNPLGKATVYGFVWVDGVKRVSSLKGEPSANCPLSNARFTYDERGLLKTKTDNKGHVTTYSYNTRGLEESRTEAVGTPQARTVTTTWHPTLNLRATVSEPARITTYHYDAQGRATGQTVTER